MSGACVYVFYILRCLTRKAHKPYKQLGKPFKFTVKALAGRTEKQLAQFLSQRHVIPSLLFLRSSRSDVTVGLWMWHIHMHKYTHTQTHTLYTVSVVCNGRKAKPDHRCCDSCCHHVLYAQIQSPECNALLMHVRLWEDTAEWVKVQSFAHCLSFSSLSPKIFSITVLSLEN